jgi:hypothetical protein
MDRTACKRLAIFFFILSGIFAAGGLSVAARPSTMPIATVAGAFALPALFLWWGTILVKRSKRLPEEQATHNKNSVDALTANERTATQNAGHTSREISQETKKFFGISILVVLFLTLLVFIINTRSDPVEECVKSGMKVWTPREINPLPQTYQNPNESFWDKIERGVQWETREQGEHRIRLQCMRAAAGKH